MIVEADVLGRQLLLAELAAEMGADKTIADLSSLFARHTQAVDPTESAWFTEVTAEDTALLAETELEQPAILQTLPDLAADPVLQFLTEMGGVIAEVQVIREPVSSLLVPLPPRKPTKRRRVKLTDAPMDEPESIPAMPKPSAPPRPWKPLSSPQHATQLALF